MDFHRTKILIFLIKRLLTTSNSEFHSEFLIEEFFTGSNGTSFSWGESDFSNLGGSCPVLLMLLPI